MKRLAVLFLLTAGCVSTALPLEGPDASAGHPDASPVAQDDAGWLGEADAGAEPDAGAPVCGDTVCDPDAESCTSCPADCGTCEACGDGRCAPGLETCAECASDCGECPARVCGDKTCDPVQGEDCSSCPEDCGACPHCGDGQCNEAESCRSCAADCGPCNPCGDGTCDGPTETCTTCPADCGRCDPCGDGRCDEAKEDCKSCPKDCDCTVRKGCVQGRFSAFFGNLHSHTSYSDGKLTPAEAFQHARNAGLDFQLVTDHMGQMAPGQYEACKDQAVTKTVNGTFVAACGYEWVMEDSGKEVGHFNLLFPPTRIAKPGSLAGLYNVLDGCDACVGQWNHPPWPGRFGDYKFFAAGKARQRLIEFSGSGTWAEKTDAYFTALRNGWRVSPSSNEDNHSANWGDSARATGVWATELTRSAVREAILANRTFATEDDTASVVLKSDDVCWMGSVVRGTGAIEFTVVARDRQAGDKFRRIDLLGTNGKPLEGRACNGANPCTVKFTRSPTQATFWVALATQEDGDRVISAPIWLEP